MDNGANIELQKPSEETLQQIDFVIQGLENGKYKEIAEQVKFHQKLKGDDDPTYISSLWAFIENQQKCIHDLQLTLSSEVNNRIELGSRIQELESTLTNHARDMRGIAGGLVKLARPDPFDMDYTMNCDMAATEAFINEY